VNLLVPKIRSGVAELGKLKDKKAISTETQRLQTLLTSIPEGSTSEADKLLLELFAQRAEIKKIKGETNGGADVIETLFNIMIGRSVALREAAINAHAELDGDELSEAMEAAIKTHTAKEVFDLFSPYLLTGNSKEKKNANTITKFQAVESAIESTTNYGWWNFDESEKRRQQFDPRWIDLAVKLEHFELVNSLAHKGHTGAMTFAKKRFDELLKKAKDPDDLRMAVSLLLRLGHPDATEAFFQALSKKKKTTYYLYWYIRTVPELPRTALPRLEEFVGTLPEKETKDWIDAINELRAKES
jgi:hypothetical protein